MGRRAVIKGSLQPGNDGANVRAVAFSSKSGLKCTLDFHFHESAHLCRCDHTPQDSRQPSVIEAGDKVSAVCEGALQDLETTRNTF